MCTVSYIPISQGFILTSNRDEKVIRNTELPKVYLQNDVKLLYPKDAVANGTWIAASNSKRYACLLNGAFEKHDRKESYRKSRGQILLDSFNYPTIFEFVNNIDLEGIEPFTLLLIDTSNEIHFYELRWDENQKHLKALSTKLAQIWSSATLYSPKIRKTRENLFFDWITKFRDEEDVNILRFHLSKHDLQEAHDIIVKVSEELQTVSVSQIEVTDSIQKFEYHDLLSKVQTKHLLNEI